MVVPCCGTLSTAILPARLLDDAENRSPIPACTVAVFFGREERLEDVSRVAIHAAQYAHRQQRRARAARRV